jgi:hypothetical protein
VYISFGIRKCEADVGFRERLNVNTSASGGRKVPQGIARASTTDAFNLDAYLSHHLSALVADLDSNPVAMTDKNAKRIDEQRPDCN